MLRSVVYEVADLVIAELWDEQNVLRGGVSAKRDWPSMGVARVFMLWPCTASNGPIMAGVWGRMVPDGIARLKERGIGLLRALTSRELLQDVYAPAGWRDTGEREVIGEVPVIVMELAI